MTLLEKVTETSARYDMFERGETVLVAVSGGVDSVVLLDALARLKDELSLKLVVCHMDHALRGKESRADMRFVEKLARSKGLRFEGRILKEGELKSMGGSLQEKAREERYAFFEKAAKKHRATKVALGHNMDDQAETVLMRVLIGAGLRGLSGIPPRRGIFVRPLVEIKRAEIEGYARERKIKHREDSSNERADYLRNALRLKLIPLIERKFSPGVKDLLANLARTASLAYEHIDEEASKLLGSALVVKKPWLIELKRAGLVRAPEVLSSEVVMKAVGIVKGDTRGVYSIHVEACLKLINGKKPNGRIDLPSGVRVSREYEKIVFSRLTPRNMKETVLVETGLNVPGVTVLDGIKASIEASVLDVVSKLDKKDDSIVYFDFDLLSLPLTIRPFEDGDRISPFGMTGTKKLKDLFIDMKVLPKKRRLTPLVVSAGEIIWVAGLRRAATAPITSDTRRVLRLRLKSMKERS
jgi:tRNA(Ile)-lysidine synthase